MDWLMLMMLQAGGIVALIMACRTPGAGWLTHTFAWAGGVYLALVFVWTGMRTDALSIVTWTGEARTGPLTLLVLALAVSLPFLVGWGSRGRDADRRDRRSGV